VQSRSVPVPREDHAAVVVFERATAGDTVLDARVGLEGGDGLLEGSARVRAAP
jgi:hypothetical protein